MARIQTFAANRVAEVMGPNCGTLVVPKGIEVTVHRGVGPVRVLTDVQFHAVEAVREPLDPACRIVKSDG